MPPAGYKPYLNHSRLGRFESAGLESLMNWRGPVRDLIDGNYPEEFIGAVRLIRTGSRWSVRVKWGANVRQVREENLRVRVSGRVQLRWAARLKRVVDDLYIDWLHWLGDVTTEPPADCPNDVHKPWHAEHSHLNDPSFVPDDGHWRCLGCGWLVDTDGRRVREVYSEISDKPRPGQRVRSRWGAE